MRIVYKQPDNSVAVLIPSEEAISLFETEAIALVMIAKKDTPKDLPYWILEDIEIPTDRTYRNSWEVDVSWGDPDGYGGDSNEFDI